jgi:hypothetical protein
MERATAEVTVDSAIDGSPDDTAEAWDGNAATVDAPHDQAADANQAADVRDVGLDRGAAVDLTGPVAQWSGCFARNDLRSCGAYCASIAESCAAASCDGITYELWDSPGSCSAYINRRGWSSDGCTAQIPSLGLNTTVRCCCQP